MSENLMRRGPDQKSVLDTRALEIAMEARTIIAAHKEECTADRIDRRAEMKEIRQLIEAVKGEVSRTINKGLVWFVGILVVIVAYFLIRYGLAGEH